MNVSGIYSVTDLQFSAARTTFSLNRYLITNNVQPLLSKFYAGN